jgi:phosphate transport system substrate-binding protein
MPPAAGCVDFARSSSGPGANASATGQLVYVPFALDAVTAATGPAVATTNAVATNIKDADLFTLADYTTMYGSCLPVTPAGSTVSYVPDGTVTDATHQPIHLYVPQSGSGTRNFWLAQMNVPAGTTPTCVHDHAFDSVNGLFDGAQVEEHDGTVYAGDADGFGPFSIAQFVSQRNGHNDRRHNAALHNIGGVSPCGNATAPSSCQPSGTLNVSYPVRREVYNVMSFARITSTAAADAQFVATFNGSASLQCTNTGTILTYGFALLNSAPLGHTCGQIATDLRAFATI